MTGPTKVTHKTAKVGDLDIFYREAGPEDAPAVLLLHGFPTSSQMFRNLIPATKGFAVFKHNHKMWWMPTDNTETNLEQGLYFQSVTLTPPLLARTRYWYGRMLLERGRHRADGLGMAEDAGDEVSTPTSSGNEGSA